jgi:hypothetical protein
MISSIIGTTAFCRYIAPFITKYIPSPLNPNGISDNVRKSIAAMLALYLAIIIQVKTDGLGPSAMYEFVWACNIAFVVAIYGLLAKKPHLIGAALVMVSIDQVGIALRPVSYV